MAYKLKYSLPFIFMYAVRNYLSADQVQALENEIGKRFPQQERAFFTILKKHFDIEKFLTEPIIKEDIWLYNYLKYDAPNKKLVKKYEREIILPMEKNFAELKDILK